MKPTITNRSMLLAIAALGCAGGAFALSLGPVSGATVVGRPLELSAPIQFDESSLGNGSGCVSADVHYGDRAVAAAAVQVSIASDAARQVSTARIASAVPVNEPFVTVVLRAGCNRQTTRRYVLLADAPKQEPMTLAAATSVDLTASTAPFVRAVQNSALGGAPPPAAGRSAAAPGPRAARSFAFRPESSARRGGSGSGPAAQARPGRLQLALWDPSSEQLPWLRTSSELRSSPTADAAHRAAATALWRALNARPEDLLRTAERLRGLEGDMTSLRSLTTRHRSEITSARESLQSAQSQRHASLVLVVLLAMLTGGGAAYLWHRTRRSEAVAPAASWYGSLEPRGNFDQVVEEERDPVFVAPPANVAQPAPSHPEPAPVRREPQPQVWLHAPLEFTLAEPASDPVGVAPPALGPSGLKVDALYGAQQQAEFFTSLGQYDEAIAVLTNYLEESSEEPVLPFLELFRIHHALGMRAEYDELGAMFSHSFGIDFLSFADFKEDQRELELYPVAVTRIAAGWPSQRSLEEIESLLLKKPAAPRDLLSLFAYRELLWLYSLGQEIVHSTSMPAGLQLVDDGRPSGDHFILPWARSDHDGAAELSLDRLHGIDVASELNAFAVDIDLTAPRADLPQERAFAQTTAPEARPSLKLAAVSEENAFDAAMEFQGRKHSR